MRGVTVPGARIYLVVNGKIFARCQGFSYTIDSDHKEARGLDSLVPYELMPGMVRVSGSARLIKTTADGGLEGPGITALPQRLPQLRYVTLALVDRLVDIPIFQADQCVIQSQSWTGDPRTLMTGSFSFRGITYNTEVK